MLWTPCPACGEYVETLGPDQPSTPVYGAHCLHCGHKFDWRVAHKDLLRGVVLREALFKGPSDHEHCTLCWRKFMDADIPGVEWAGYVYDELPEDWWVCRACFEEFRERFGWRVVELKMNAEPRARAGRPRD